MPVSWQDAFGAVSGLVRFSRLFHSPTNLEPDERVVLAFEAVGGECSFQVNDTNLQPEQCVDGALRSDVTVLLQPSNVVSATIRFDPRESEEHGGLWKPVSLEIHSAGQ